MHLHAVCLGDGPDMVSGSDGTKGGSLLVAVGQALAGEVSSAALRDLDDDRCLDVTIVPETPLAKMASAGLYCDMLLTEQLRGRR